MVVVDILISVLFVLLMGLGLSVAVEAREKPILVFLGVLLSVTSFGVLRWLI